MTKIKTVAVLGAGAMGSGIAQVALQAGYEVNLRDIQQDFLDRSIATIQKGFSKLEKKGVLSQNEIAAMFNRLHTYVHLKDAVCQADLIIEAIPEVLELKLDTFREVDAYAPKDAYIASNSSSMSITAMASVTSRPQQVFGLHFFIPAPVMKLVEVICTESTSQETLNTAVEFGKSLGKEVVVAQKDTPGFVANRIASPGGAYLAALLDDEGLLPEEIDAVSKKAGAPMGSCELCDFSGLDVHFSAQSYYAEKLHPHYAPANTIRKLVEAGNYGMKTGRGLYDWSKGRPDIDISKASDKVDPFAMILIQANEACKLVDDGVCTFEDADRAMKFGYNAPVGPIEAIQNFEPGVLAEKLNLLADKYGREIFRPAESILSGAYKRK